jgi:hypothetical protein
MASPRTVKIYRTILAPILKRVELQVPALPRLKQGDQELAAVAENLP